MSEDNLKLSKRELDNAQKRQALVATRLKWIQAQTLNDYNGEYDRMRSVLESHIHPLKYETAEILKKTMRRIM